MIRRWLLERKLDQKLKDSELSEEEHQNRIKDLERKETENMRLQRQRLGMDDFEPLTIIGRGAFGEVKQLTCTIIFTLSFQIWYICFAGLLFQVIISFSLAMAGEAVQNEVNRRDLCDEEAQEI
jgi:hypothetical protein